MPHAGDTIAALSSAAGVSTLAVIRISGPRAFEVCSKLLDLKAIPEPNSIIRAVVHIANGAFSCRLLLFAAPRSYTGEDVAELTIPGSPALARAVLAALFELGCRSATAGEFTRRAFENNRMDIFEAQAVAALIASEDAVSRKAALSALGGSISREIVEIRNALVDALARVEANLDFPDEDIVIIGRSELISGIAQLTDITHELLDKCKRPSTGLPVVAIVGPPNVGKTSLFNALSSSTGLVSEHAGTTTDSLTAIVAFDGIRFELLDTAGLGSEAISVAEDRAREAADSADLLIIVSDASSNPNFAAEPNSNKPAIFVQNKCDLPEAPDICPNSSQRIPLMQVSALTGYNLDGLRSAISKQVRDISGAGRLVLSDFHYAALAHLSSALQEARKACDVGSGDELIATHLRDAVAALDSASHDISNEVLDSVFARFCVGK